jgi:hypothetical protein
LGNDFQNGMKSLGKLKRRKKRDDFIRIQDVTKDIEEWNKVYEIITQWKQFTELIIEENENLYILQLSGLQWKKN